MASGWAAVAAALRSGFAVRLFLWAGPWLRRPGRERPELRLQKVCEGACCRLNIPAPGKNRIDLHRSEVPVGEQLRERTSLEFIEDAVHAGHCNAEPFNRAGNHPFVDRHSQGD